MRKNMIECCYLWGGFGVGSWDGQLTAIIQVDLLVL